MKRSISIMKRGFTLIEMLIVVAIITVVVGIPLAILASTSHGLAHQAAYMKNAVEIDTVTSRMNASAKTSVSVYTPNTCGAGSGTGTACNSVRFYGVDNTGGKHYWGWDYDAASQTLKGCSNYVTSEAACPATNITDNLKNISSFTATPTKATDIATSLGLTVVGLTNTEKNMYGPDPRIVSGNRTMVVSVSNPSVSRTVDLLQSGAPFSRSVLLGFVSAPILGPTVTAVPDPNYTFVWPGQAAAVKTFNLDKYSTYAKYASGPTWGLSACLSSGVATDALPNPLPTLDNVDVTVTPQAEGLCNFTVTADPNANPTIASPATGNVDVMGQLSYAPDEFISDNSIVFVTPNAPSQGASAYKTYDSTDIVLTPTGCANNINITSSNPYAPAAPSSDAANTSITFAPYAAGVCTATIQDQYHDTYGEPALTFEGQVMGYLSLDNPASPKLNTSLTFANSSASAQNVPFYKTWHQYALTLVQTSSTCGGIATFSTNGESHSTTPSATPASINLQVTPIGPGSCAVTYQDQYGSSDKTITVAINVGGVVATPTPLPGPTPTPGSTPTPYPCAIGNPCLYHEFWLNSQLANCQPGLDRCYPEYDWSVTDASSSTPATIDQDQCCVAYSNSTGTFPASGGTMVDSSNCNILLGRIASDSGGNGESPGGSDDFWIVIVDPSDSHSLGESLFDFSSTRGISTVAPVKTMTNC